MSANGSTEPESPTIAIFQLRNEIDHSNYEVKRDGNDYFDLYMRAQEETKQVNIHKCYHEGPGFESQYRLFFKADIFSLWWN